MGMQEASPQVAELRGRIDALKEAKGKLGREIGDARKSGGDSTSLVSELQSVSSELKTLQKTLKKQLNQSKTEDDTWRPTEPGIPEAVLSHQECDVQVAELGSAAAMRPLVAGYVEQHPAASLWHMPEIPDFIHTTSGHSYRYLFARDGQGNVRGVLPVVRLKSRLFGNFMVSVPWFNYGGVLADNRSIADALIHAADNWRMQSGSRHVELRHVLDEMPNLPKRTDKLTFWLPLPKQPEQLWDSFQPKVRAQVRRGGREISGVEIGGVELLDDFYRVFARNMRDLGTPVYGKRFFANLLETLGPKARLVVARIDGEPAGCAFVTGFGNRMEIPWASTLREHNHTGINMAMYWKVLEFAVAGGYEIFDFGRCSREAGTYRFKAQWGAFPVPLNWHYCLPEGESLPALNPDNPKFRLLIALWKRLPVPIANILGPSIVKSLP